MELGSITITREEIMDFARLWDPQPFHLSDAAAAASPLKKLSASGWHTLAILADMLERNGHPFTGAKSVKWIKPFFPDQRHMAHLDKGIVRFEDASGELVCEVVL
jgi:acyl dehydratase